MSLHYVKHCSNVSSAWQLSWTTGHTVTVFHVNNKKKRHHRQKNKLIVTQTAQTRPKWHQRTQCELISIRMGTKRQPLFRVSPTTKTRTSKWKVFRGKNCCHLTLALGHPNEPAAQNKPHVIHITSSLVRQKPARRVVSRVVLTAPIFPNQLWLGG